MKKRFLGMALLSASVVSLMAGAAYAYYGASDVRTARYFKHDAQRKVTALRKQIRLAEDRREFGASLESFLARKNEIGLNARQWETRRLEYKKRSLDRGRILEILRSVSGGDDSFFLPVAFEVSVPESDLGLFDRPPHDKAALNFRLLGTMYLWVGGQS
jgi:hypothetical protein